MNILDLLKKYENNDSIDYLRKVFGSDKFINDIFTNTMGIKYAIDNMNLDYKTYEIFHNIYIKVVDDKSIDNTLLNCLTILESYYKPLRKSIDCQEQIKNSSKKLNYNDVAFQLSERIRKMYSIDNLPINYEFYDIATDISRDIKEYSLDKQYNLDSAHNYKEGLNSVTLITETQTISRFNDDSVNGRKGSGYHDANFDQIIEAVYGRKFLNSQSGQDIKIKHISEISDNSLVKFRMTIEMPYVINSTQFESLSNLNEEIKKIGNKLGIDFEIHVVLIDYDNINFIKFIENKTNLDEALETVAVDDTKEKKYKEVCFLGYSNLENHYNDIKYIK